MVNFFSCCWLWIILQFLASFYFSSSLNLTNLEMINKINRTALNASPTITSHFALALGPGTSVNILWSAKRPPSLKLSLLSVISIHWMQSDALRFIFTKGSSYNVSGSFVFKYAMIHDILGTNTATMHYNCLQYTYIQ